MLNDFIPAIISIAILVSAFLYAFVSDMRRIRRHGAAPQQARAKVVSIGKAVDMGERSITG
jgi:hypothetical protein